MFKRETFNELRRVRVTALCGSLIGVFAGWGHIDSSPLGNQPSWTGNHVVPIALPEGDNVVPVALAEMDWELRRGHLPMELNEAVESWVLRLTGDRRSVFEYALSRAGLYSDMIRTKIRERGMPAEMLYLALIESDFHTDARSRALASGMWQFTEPTARLYGLRIDAYVDQRYDPVRATDDALDHLSDLYQQYGSWYLAAAAYNVGAMRVTDALLRYTDGHKGDDSLFWEISDHLPSETANYVPKLLAVTYLARSAERYGFEVTPADPYQYDFVWSPGGVDLGEVAHSLGITAEQMYDLNPELIRNTTPPGEIYALRIPVGMASQVVAALASQNPGTRLADD